MVITLTIPVAPRTKKTSNRIVRFGRAKEHVRVLPSLQFEEFFEKCMLLKPRIMAALSSPRVTGQRVCDGVLPLAAPVSVCATFYRDRNVGDWTGYVQALGDVLQAEIIRPDAKGRPKLVRDGLGIIKDDRQIIHWDGTRLDVDRANPRIEVEVRVLGEAQDGLELVPWETRASK
jgi:hypothetical protein